jgi:gamma-glutamylcyclotransferase (GGCT)/AIG2-like uncharacterized protein YtfP
VYGGLMRGFDLHHYIAGATYIGEGSTRGKLIALGRYPGLIDGDAWVAGEIYKLGDIPADLEALDDLEDFDPGDPQRSTYLRVSRDVRSHDGSSLHAWVYLYNRDAAGIPAVTSGDWRVQGRRS